MADACSQNTPLEMKYLSFNKHAVTQINNIDISTPFIVLIIILIHNIFVGFWEVSCVQLPGWSQEAFPDYLRFTSTNSPALRHEQWVLLNTCRSNGEYDKCLSMLSNSFMWVLCDHMFVLESLKTFKNRRHQLCCYFFIFSFFLCLFYLSLFLFVETSLRSTWIRSCLWDSDASGWLKRHYGPQHR